ncbi:hypothetical protein ACHAO1_008873 [Botrytis cinerea]
MSQTTPTQNVENSLIRALEIDIDQYIRERHQDCKSWNGAITGTLSNRIDKCEMAIERIDKEIDFCDERTSFIETDRLSAPEYQSWLLENYEQLLTLLYAMRAWFRQFQDDYEAIHHALSTRDVMTAEEIQRDLDEPSEFGFPTEDTIQSELKDNDEDGRESGFEDNPKQF